MTVIYCLDRIYQAINLIAANYVLCHHIKSRLKWTRNNKMNCELMLTYDTPTYMFNMYKNQPSRQKRFPQYGIPIWSFWPNIRFLPSIVAEKNATKNILGWTEGRTEVKQYTPSPPMRGYKNYLLLCIKISASERLNLVHLKFNKIHPTFELFLI